MENTYGTANELIEYMVIFQLPGIYLKLYRVTVSSICTLSLNLVCIILRNCE